MKTMNSYPPWFGLFKFFWTLSKQCLAKLKQLLEIAIVFFVIINYFFFMNNS